VLAPAAQQPQLSIDISCPQGTQQQTRWLLSINEKGQTDVKRTPASHYRDPAMHAASITVDSQR